MRWPRLVQRHRPPRPARPAPLALWGQVVPIALATVAAALLVAIPSGTLWLVAGLQDSQQQDKRQQAFDEYLWKRFDLIQQELESLRARVTRLETFHEQQEHK